MIRLVAFDFDGTLVESNAIKDACIWTAIAGVPGADRVIAAARAVGSSRYEIFANVARDLGLPSEDGRRMAERYTDCCVSRIRAAPERRGAGQVLATLRRRGLKLVINTGTPRQDMPALLRARGWMSLFDGVYGSPQSKEGNLRSAMRRFGVTPRQSVMVGDSVDDYCCARSLNTHFVAITAENRIPYPLKHPMRDLRPFLPWLDRLTGGRT